MLTTVTVIGFSIGLIITDIILVNRALDLGAIERNVLIVFLMRYFGKYWYIPKILGCSLVFLLLGVYIMPMLLYINVVLLTMVINNILIIRDLERRQ